MNGAQSDRRVHGNHRGHRDHQPEQLPGRFVCLT